MMPAFRRLVRRFDYPAGYLYGFAIYWLGWCIALPALLLRNKGGLFALFGGQDRGIKELLWKMRLALAWPLFFPVAFVLVPRRKRITPSILSVSVLLGIATGLTEETLWRGVFVRLFPGNAWLNTLYPSVGFAVWHAAPQTVRPSTQPGGTAGFVLYALALGLSYTYYARETGSIRLCTFSHIVHDSLGLGGLAYEQWLEKTGELKPPGCLSSPGK